MNFSEAMVALQDGKKVTRKPWLGSMYFKLEGKDVKSYQPTMDMYRYNEDIMISDGWEVEGEDGSFKFYDIVSFLQKGKKCKLSDWKDMYIKYDSKGEYLLLHSMAIFPYFPDFNAFLADDWVVV